MSRVPIIFLVFPGLLACGEPPPPVSESILQRVTTEISTVSQESRSAPVLVATVPQGFWENTAPPVMGRTFFEEDFGGAAGVCIISYSLWERFGSGESDAPLVYGGQSLTIVGVMPSSFDIPEGAQVWVPR